MMPWDDPEAREQKKYNRVMRNAVISAGIGIGLLLVKPFFIGVDGEDIDTSKAALFNMLGFSLLGYGALIVACGIFLRRQVLKINLVAFYLVLPVLILKALSDWNS